MRKKVLVIVKAEPVPSNKYGASVCTAGITEDGEFVRLYPIPYRMFCDKDAKFNKYDWIEVECEKATEDQRPESYKIIGEHIKVIGHIGTDYNWAERNSLILPLVSKNFSELKEKGVSLGVVRPSELYELYRSDSINKTIEEEVKSRRKVMQMIFDTKDGSTDMKQIPVIDGLERYYRYKFKCEGEDKPHEVMCEDWEIYESSRSWLDIYGTEDAVWEKMHQKFFDKFKDEHDLHFFVGTHHVWGTWMIIGLYYPPKVGPPGTRQTRLFNTTVLM